MVAGARWVLHLDMDAFYASVEQLARPTLRDRPVLVGGLGPRAVVAGASYQARVFGARSAMPMGQARRLCPQAVVLPPRFALYQALSERVMAVLAEAAPVLEPVSLDEAFLEPPELAGADPARVERFAVELRRAVHAATGLPASVGAGSGKQLAKIASELAKPDGLRVIDRDGQQAVLDPLPVRALWGVGPVAEAGLRRLGVLTIGQLAALDLRDVTDLLGSAVGTELHRLARGIDDRPVAPRGAAKQISAETTFDVDLTAMVDVHEAVARITEAAHRRLLRSGRAARTVSVKVRSAAFTTATRSETAGVASTDLGELTAVAQRLALAAVPEGGVRLIGVSLAGLVDTPPPMLFGAVEPAEGAEPQVDTDIHPLVPVPPVPGSDHGGSDHQTPSRAGSDHNGSGHQAPGRAGSDHQAPGPAGSDHRAPGRAGSDHHAPGRAGPDHQAPGRAGPGRAGHGRDGSDHDGSDRAVPDRAGPDRAGFDAAGPIVGQPAVVAQSWRPGDDVRHREHGHGWVQGAGHGRVTVRFETRSTGPGRAHTFAAEDPDLAAADPLGSLE